MTSKSMFKRVIDCLLGKSTLCNADGFPSANLALRKILGEKLFNRLVLSTPDRRQLMEESAKLKGVTEDELIKVVAEKLDLPVFFKPKPIDLKLLPENITVKDLKRAGVFPLISRTEVCGVLAVDPAELSNLKNLYSGTNIYLTSWTALLAAIEESEQIYLRSKFSQNNSAESFDQQLIARLLERMLHEMELKNAEAIQFEENAGSITYSFEDYHNEHWQGEIDFETGRKLLQYLQYRIASDKVDLSFFGFGSLVVTAEDGQICIRRPRESNIILFPRNADIFNADKQLKENDMDFSGLKVMLIDDNPSYLSVMQTYLKRHGYKINSLSGISAARAFLQAKADNLPDVIVCDLHLQDGTAFTLLQELKTSPIHSAIPFIVLTSDQEQENELKALGSGADAFIAKNKDPRILALHIKRLLKYRVAA